MPCAPAGGTNFTPGAGESGHSLDLVQPWGRFSGEGVSIRSNRSILTMAAAYGSRDSLIRPLP